MSGGALREGPLRVLHVSGDFPDTIQAFKTQVIRSLVDLTRDAFDHCVISTNRSSPGAAALFAATLKNGLKPPLTIAAEPFEYGTALTYRAPARGAFHATMLDQLGDWLADHVARGPVPDLIVGHKLTIEGIAVYRAAKRLGIPYAISIQGGSDAKVLGARPDLFTRLRKVFHEAAVVFPFAPWSLEFVERKLGKRIGPVFMLPCPTDLDQPSTPVPGGSGLVTTFHLMNYHRKNLAGMAGALRSLHGSGSPVSLTVIGGGSVSDLQKCETIARGVDSIRFAGAMNRAEVRQAFSKARGFIMPSLRESFGLVFVEALFAGLPIAYPAGTAVDGYFDGLPFAVRIEGRDQSSIAKAMLTLDRDEAELKEQLTLWLRSDACRQFMRSDIAAQFTRGLKQACGMLAASA